MEGKILQQAGLGWAGQGRGKLCCAILVGIGPSFGGGRDLQSEKRDWRAEGALVGVIVCIALHQWSCSGVSEVSEVSEVKKEREESAIGGERESR